MCRSRGSIIRVGERTRKMSPAAAFEAECCILTGIAIIALVVLAVCAFVLLYVLLKYGVTADSVSLVPESPGIYGTDPGISLRVPVLQGARNVWIR